MGVRINVIGCSGSGKSTLSRALAEALQLKFIELDEFQHQENWRQASREEFLAQVQEAVKADGWVIDGNYSMIRPTVWPLVDTVIWLDYPLSTCFSQVCRRTFRRWFKREELWNGNREHLWPHLFTKKSLFLWVVTSHPKKRREIGQLFASAELQKKILIHLRSPEETSAWLDQICKGTSQEGQANIATIEE